MLKSLFQSGKNKFPSKPKKAKPYSGSVDMVITNACLVTCDGDFTIIDQGCVVIADGKIVDILDKGAPHQAALVQRATQIVDAAGQIIIPGLINTHCHAGDSLFRGLVEGLPLEPWLEKLWVAETAILNPDTIELGSKLGYAENLLNGVTTVMDMFWEPASMLAASHDVGLRVATGGIFFDPPGIDGATADQRDNLAREFFTAYKEHPSLIPSISAHAAYTVSPDSLKIALAVRDDFDTLITIHAAETKFEQHSITEQYGRSVIRHLDHVGLLSERAVLAHCVHLDDEEIEIIANAGASVSHNPASNLKLGSGIAPITDFLTGNVCVALGTDGGVSGNDLDLWKAIRFAAILHNGATQNPLAISAQDVIKMATINGAEALGIADEAGSLEVGKRADMVMINPRQLHAVPVFDPVNYLAYAASNADVETVWVAGRKTVENHRLLTIDTDDVLDRVNYLLPSIRDSLRE